MKKIHGYNYLAGIELAARISAMVLVLVEIGTLGGGYCSTFEWQPLGMPRPSAIKSQTRQERLAQGSSAALPDPPLRKIGRVRPGSQ